MIGSRLVGMLRAGTFVSCALGVFVSATALAGPEPALHKGYVRDKDGTIVAVSRGPKLNYADDLKASKFGAFDVVSQICFGGSFLSGITAAAVPNYTFSSSASWNETSFTMDDGTYNYNPNIPPIAKPRTVDNWTRAWRESAERIPANGMKGHFDVAKNGNGAAPIIAQDRFVVGGQGKETPVYGSTNAAADARKIGDAAMAGGQRYAILVSWDKDASTDRHGVSIARSYDTLTRIYGIPANNIAVLHADGAGNALGAYVNTDMITNQKSAVEPAWGGEPVNMNATPINAANTRANWTDALAGKLFNGGLGADITNKDSILVYNTGHGGHTGTIEKGLLDQKDAGDNAISVRYLIPDADNFFRTKGMNLEHNGDVQKSYLPNDIFKAQLSFGALLNLAGVKVSFDGGEQIALTDGIDFPSVPLDPLVDGNLQHFRFDGLNGNNRIVAGMTVVDFYNVPAATLTALGGNLMTAALLNAGDQEYVSVVVPAPGGLVVLIAGLGGARRRRRPA